MASEDPKRRQEIESSLKAIVDSSDKWLGNLKKRESQVRLASSFLTGVLGALVAGAGVMLYFVIHDQLYTYFQHPNPNMSHAPAQLALAFGVAGGSAIAAGLAGGFATYFLLKKKHNARLRDLSSLIFEMKGKMNNQEQQKANGGKGITVDALSLADKIITLLPELVRKRNQDSLLFGAVAFIISAVIGQNAAVAILVGVLVWLFFRYETKKAYDQEISKFEAQKKEFERRKRDFIETL